MRVRIMVGKCDYVVVVQEAFYDSSTNCFNIVTTNSIFQTEMGTTMGHACLDELMRLGGSGHRLFLTFDGYTFHKVQKN